MKSCATNQSRSASVGQMAKAAGNVSTIRPRVLINAQIAADLRAYFAVVFRQRIFTAARTSRLQMPIANTYSKCPKINLAEIVDRTRLTRASAQRWRSRCLMRSKEAFAYSRSTGYFCSVVNRPTKRITYVGCNITMKVGPVQNELPPKVWDVRQPLFVLAVSLRFTRKPIADKPTDQAARPVAATRVAPRGSWVSAFRKIEAAAKQKWHEHKSETLWSPIAHGRAARRDEPGR